MSDHETTLRELANRLRWKFDAKPEAAACLAGADALRRGTCGTCRHANTHEVRDGWCYCAASQPPTDVLFSGPDQTEKWAMKMAHALRYPFIGLPVPLDEGCKGYAPTEPTR